MPILTIKLTILSFILFVPPVCFAGSSTLPTLTDITEQAGIHFKHSFGDDELSNIVESTGAGVALCDYDNDGYLDIYFVNGSYEKEINHPKGRKLSGILQNKLFRNKGDGTFEDVTEKAGVGDMGYGMAALFGDLDNDGDQDLYITNYGSNKLFRNNGDGTFSDVTVKAGVGCELWSLGTTFIDIDGDGLLDIYVGNYLRFDPSYRNYYAGDAFPGPLAYSGQPDILYRNTGDLTFTDVTQQAGVNNPQGRAMGVASADIDNDGYMDIFVANDAMENYLYHNNGNGTFADIALLSGTGFGQNGEATSAMSPEFGDFDMDGNIDILIPDMGYSSLFLNSGKGFFKETSALSGLAAACGQYTSWSGNFFDFNADSLLDILITNGDSHFYEPEEDLILINKGGGKVEDVSRFVGKGFQQKNVGRGSAVGDIDNDGDLDIVITNLNGSPVIYRSESLPNAQWLQISLVSKYSNRDAIGARVRVFSPSGVQVRDVISSSGYLSQSDRRLHFGLGSSTNADKVEITWPDGKKDTYKNVKSQQFVTYSESW